MEVLQIIEKILPAVLLAVLTSALVTVSTQGVKNFFSVELKGNVARGATVVIAAVWSYILAIHYGQGTWTDFAMNLTMTFLGATGIYEVLMQNKADKSK